jgi:hypothetical protein
MHGTEMGVFLQSDYRFIHEKSASTLTLTNTVAGSGAGSGFVL